MLLILRLQSRILKLIWLWVTNSRIKYNYNIDIRSILDLRKTKKGTGVRVYGPRCKYSKAMGNQLNIYQAGQKYWRSIGVLARDSQATLRALSSYTFSSRLVWECLRRLNVCTRRERRGEPVLGARALRHLRKQDGSRTGDVGLLKTTIGAGTILWDKLKSNNGTVRDSIRESYEL